MSGRCLTPPAGWAGQSWRPLRLEAGCIARHSVIGSGTTAAGSVLLFPVCSCIRDTEGLGPDTGDVGLLLLPIAC